LAEQVTLEQIEELAAQLTPSDRLRLAAHICDELSRQSTALQRVDQGVSAELEAYLAECEEVAELWEGEFDSAADVRRLREEG
jgi:hypothetical protein